MELPNELWNEISLYMDYYDLFNFKLVSRDLCDSARKINNLDRIEGRLILVNTVEIL